MGAKVDAAKSCVLSFAVQEALLRHLELHIAAAKQMFSVMLPLLPDHN